MSKKAFITLAIAAIVFSVLGVSCKKSNKENTRPTPANNRLLSYSKFTTDASGITVEEDYRFYYDNSQRVIRIYYSTNDQAKTAASESKLDITFTYSSDTIYKTYTSQQISSGSPMSPVIERDTFVKPSSTTFDAYTPGEWNHFEFFGKLISHASKRVSDSGTSISSTSQYTSDNGDLLNHTYDGTLQANFPDSGISFFQVPHDTALTPPLTVTWTDLTNPLSVVTHTTNNYSDQLTGYTSGDPIAIQAKDQKNVIAYDTLIWPGGLWDKESFLVYPDLDNRIGDYLQIESFTMYGVNLYQNAHLVKQISEQSGPVTNVTYTIDADSKITQTSVTTTDLFLHVTNVVYKFQYEVF